MEFVGEPLDAKEVEQVKEPYKRNWSLDDVSDGVKEGFRKLWPGLNDEQINDQMNKPILTNEEVDGLMKVLDKDYKPLKECCNQYKIGMDQIIAQNMYCDNRPAAPKYTAGPLSFCPYCGRKIWRD